MDDKINVGEGFPPHSIAIVGLGGRFPGARNLDEFWNNIKDGVESIETFTDADLDAAGINATDRAHENFVRRGTVLEGADLFDASFFGMSPREAQIIDPQQRIFLECAWEALEHAGYAPGTTNAAVGVYAGASMNTYIFSQILRNPVLIAAVGDYQLMLGNDKDFLCTRVSYKLDLRGPSMTIQTACSTSLVAVQVACRALERHECDVALAGGVSASFPQRGGYLFQEGMILSPDGHCRPFDVAARGTRGGAGCGIVVLKRLSDALADRDTIHAIIRGVAINNDGGGGKAGFTAPSVDGQVEVIATAQMLAGIDPRSIGYLEAHGTGTPLGDPIEVAALTQVFRAATADVGFCRLGSLKANLGHLDAAAGIAGLIKAVLSLKHKWLPPLVNFERANPQLDLEHSPFMASARGAPWPSGSTPRRAGVSSFGIGGTNAHVVLEEVAQANTARPSDKAELFVLSARNAASLDTATQRLAAHLQEHPEQSLTDVAWTLQAGRRAFGHRRIIVARDSNQVLDPLNSPGRPPVYSAVHEGGDRRVAFLFSGQGSQYAGMGAGLYQSEPIYRAAIDQCSKLLQEPLQRDLREVLFAPTGDATINQTRYAQPALFMTEFALALLWQKWGVRPAAMLGHSIGEYVAAHLAGVMSLEDALALVAARGMLMQEMPSGTMAAVQLDVVTLRNWLKDHTRGVEIAAVNAPRMCTIAGEADAMAACLANLVKQGIEARPLHTSHAFHSAMLEPALAPFTAVVEKIRLEPPRVPYISNVTGDWISASEATSPAYYAQHLRRTVQFEAGIQSLAKDPTFHFLEVGPGISLTSLTRLCLGPDGTRRATASLGAGRNKIEERERLLETAGRLWLAGVPLDWIGLHGGHQQGRIPLPTYPFERKKHWVEATTSVLPTAVERAAVSARRDNVGDWMFSPTWQRSSSNVDTCPPLAGSWLVVGDDDTLADCVQDRIAAVGGEPLRIRTASSYVITENGDFSLLPGSAEDVSALSRELRRRGKTVAGAIILWGLGVEAEAGSRRRQLLYHATVAFAAGFHLLPKSLVRIVVATSGAQSVLDEPVSFIDAAIAQGPVLALPTEMEGLQLRVVDLEPRTLLRPPDAAALLVAEAALADAENQIAWRSNRRWLRRFEPCPLLPAPLDKLPLKQGAVVLITGGLGGMSLAIAERLASRIQARLLLTTRSGLPPRSQWDAFLSAQPPDAVKALAINGLRAIEAAGGEFEVVVAAAADEDAMRKAVETAHGRWGSIDAAIHAAGVPGLGELSILKSTTEVDAVLDPKAGGLEVLLKVLGDSPLELMVLMSSINSVAGAPGAGDYAAANAVLDAFVESNRVPQSWRRVIAFNWGAWRDVGMAARLKVPEARRAAWDRHLQAGIETSNGLDAFERVLHSKYRRVVVLPFDLCGLLAQERSKAESWAAHLSDSKSSPSTTNPSNDKTLHTQVDPGDDPQASVETRLASIWRELLGVERVGPNDDFFELGGHSLLATRVLARIAEGLGAQLALRDLFDASTLSALAEKITASRRLADEEREEIEF